MGLEVRYHPKVPSDDVPALPKAARMRIEKAVIKKLSVYPEAFGEPLRGSLVPLWKLRVGDYRIVYDVKDDVVYVHAIAHRKNIYTKVAPKREQM